MTQALAVKLALTVATAAMFAFGFYFRHRQNKGTQDCTTVGGEISLQKALWLAYTIGAWFFIPSILWFLPGLSAPLKTVLCLHTAVWWIRGILELFMIYRWFNWSPIYGISHDAFHLMGLSVGISWASGQQGWNAMLAHPVDRIVFLFLQTTIFSTLSELGFASLFLMARQPGEEKVYFASDEPRWRIINGFTLAVVVLVYSQLLVQLAAVWATKF